MVVVSGDRVITTSRKVAAYFDKQHHHIIQKIEKLDCSDEFLTGNFSRVTYEHKGNQYVTKRKNSWQNRTGRPSNRHTGPESLASVI
ncbi:Rha family transcriptional regulator [Escherichia coli]|nr:Rha family transcriptional regulator [Escherichia coli]MCV5379962.1 Rha family transcriptional regulator [Escherichia coli]MCV5392959.1 Rha family transcriptional regulator [Escherichia coli]MCV5405419.1 Rha family transcriptional regulator [Escherichia coli]MCV5416251.1 Rha family transcriptional regulator [Escherichia coli]